MALYNVESNIILKALHEKYTKILLDTKFKFTKNGMEQNFRGYFTSVANRTYLNITFQNMPIYNKQVLSDLLFKTFEGIYPIASIKSLVYTSTQFLSDQWMVSLDIIDKESIISKILRVTNIHNHKISLYWKNASALYYFCGNKGYFKKNCLELEEANKGRLLLEQLKKEQ
jgi:hypothetical protein